MKLLAWYTVLFNLAIIVLLLLTSAGVVDPPPFSWLESIVWAVFTLPVILFACRAMKK